MLMRLKPLLTFGGQLAVCGAMVDKSEPIKNISRQITWQRCRATSRVCVEFL